ncbi:SagB/ThcOx family dehydrogenase [bacterium]|nr:SagB/ThcOx family dehydrogenase [bacterium]MBU1882753.1 SagB/ThcOx family dehydrogenase [bacterium]
MNDLNLIHKYHEQTKHQPNRYASSLGYMDWATQPDPFRSYKGAKKIELPLALDNSTPPYHLIFSENALPQAPLLLESVSQLFQFSLGIAAYKSAGGTSWALRCNASSGNLQPTEGYIVLPPLKGISEKTTISHYVPKEHSLEILSEFDTSFWQMLPTGSFLVSLSSILWREVWKYGERAFRYTQLDLGHALHALHVSAQMLGWKISLVDDCDIKVIDALFGFDKKERFTPYEYEESDILLVISKEKNLTYKVPHGYKIDTLLKDMRPIDESVANVLSRDHHKWEIIEQIDKATHYNPTSTLPLHVSTKNEREPTQESKQVILKRRSAQMMDIGRSQITKKQFSTILSSVAQTQGDVHLAIFVHNVEEFEKGLYLYIRDESDLKNLKNSFDKTFVWEKADENLYLLTYGDYRAAAKQISCNQDIAKDGAFSLGMICKFSSVLKEDNPQKYKELYYECGAIGQQLYLEATSVGLSATGIGCFLDDMMHRLLGIQDTSYQSLYHFTLGRAIVDMRVQTEQPYLYR